MWDNLIKACIAALTTLILAVTPYIVIQVNRHLSGVNLAKVQNYARIAVRAAEQLGGTNKLTKEEKYNAAGTFLLRLADKAGISLTKEDVQPLIEAAVHSINQVAVAVMPGEQPLLTAAAALPAAVVPAAPAATISEETMQSIVEQAGDFAANRLINQMMGSKTAISS